LSHPSHHYQQNHHKYFVTITTLGLQRTLEQHTAIKDTGTEAGTQTDKQTQSGAVSFGWKEFIMCVPGFVFFFHDAFQNFSSFVRRCQCCPNFFSILFGLYQDTRSSIFNEHKKKCMIAITDSLSVKILTKTG
jgi:hypothetical protein